MVTMRVATLAVAVCVVGLIADGRPRPKTHTVTMENMRFQPDHLMVARGDTVVWVNKDPFPHTATATAKGGFDSGSIAAGASWKRVFAKPGDYAYICTFHPNMKATVHVD
jgi:plastocyanin